MASLPGSRCPHVSSTAGLLLLDVRGRIVYQNLEALRILTYPEPAQVNLLISLPPTLEGMLDQGKRTSLATEFQSGRRRYVSRSFALAQDGEKPGQASVGILLERVRPRWVDISSAAQQFGLTEREQQTVELLTLGLTSKEIASRMHISPNTVKAFFRLVMMKMAVNTRSGIVGKIARMQSLA